MDCLNILQIIIESIDNKSEQFLVRFKGSMMCEILVFHILLLCLGNMEAHGDVDEYQMTRELTDYVLRNYSRNLPPRRHQGDLVNITVELFIDLIKDFDETAGVFSWYGVFGQKWTDEYITWNGTENGIWYLKMPLKDVWIPKLLIKNTAKTRTFINFDNEFDYETAHVSYYYDGSASMQIGGIIETACEANMYYYPLDKHNCKMELYPEYYEVRFVEIRDYDIFKSSLALFEQNSEWNIINVTTHIKQNGYPTIVFEIDFQRRPLFLCIALVMPIILVSFVNIFTFVLPVESGERTSFSVTLFLTFVVVMTMVAESLPSSNQMSIFASFLVVRLVTSALTTITVTISISIYHTKKSSCLSCLISKGHKKSCEHEPIEHMKENDYQRSTCELCITSRNQKVVQMIDRAAFIFLVAEIVIELIVITFILLR